MIKYIEEDTLVAFREVPNEVSLCINISNCQNHCPGCHSSYLLKNIGRELDFKAIDELIEKNDGITCFCFMGEGNDPETLKNDILYIKENYKDIKVALYSGREEVNEDWLWNNLNYLKIGPYNEEFGPLDKKTTNQRMYEYGYFQVIQVNGKDRNGWKDITYKFWNEEK